MLTTILIFAVLLVVARWWLRRSKLQRIQASKPSWAVGYAMFFLADAFVRSGRHEDAFNHVVLAGEAGLSNLTSATFQDTLVGMRAYANAHGDLGRLGDPLVMQALSGAVAVEARTALSLATSRRNIDIYLKESASDMKEIDRRNLGQKIHDCIREPMLGEEEKEVLYWLVWGYLSRSFERHHGKPFEEFSCHILEKYAGDVA